MPFDVNGNFISDTGDGLNISVNPKVPSANATLPVSTAPLPQNSGYQVLFGGVDPQLVHGRNYVQAGIDMNGAPSQTEYAQHRDDDNVYKSERYGYLYDKPVASQWGDVMRALTGYTLSYLHDGDAGNAVINGYNLVKQHEDKVTRFKDVDYFEDLGYNPKDIQAYINTGDPKDLIANKETWTALSNGRMGNTETGMIIGQAHPTNQDANFAVGSFIDSQGFHMIGKEDGTSVPDSRFKYVDEQRAGQLSPYGQGVSTPIGTNTSVQPIGTGAGQGSTENVGMRSGSFQGTPPSAGPSPVTSSQTTVKSHMEHGIPVTETTTVSKQSPAKPVNPVTLNSYNQIQDLLTRMNPDSVDANGKPNDFLTMNPSAVKEIVGPTGGVNPALPSSNLSSWLSPSKVLETATSTYQNRHSPAATQILQGINELQTKAMNLAISDLSASMGGSASKSVDTEAEQARLMKSLPKPNFNSEEGLREYVRELNGYISRHTVNPNATGNHPNVSVSFGNQPQAQGLPSYGAFMSQRQ